MASKTFQCRLVTPTAQVLDEPVSYASVPAWDGLFGILPGRAPIVAKLGLGELRLDFPDNAQGAGGSRSFLVEDGFLQMVGDRLTILAAKAIPAESISEAEAQAELAEVEARRAPVGTGESTAQAGRVSRTRDLARAKLRLAKKFRSAGRGI